MREVELEKAVEARDEKPITKGRRKKITVAQEGATVKSALWSRGVP